MMKLIRAIGLSLASVLLALSLLGPTNAGSGPPPVTPKFNQVARPAPSIRPNFNQAARGPTVVRRPAVTGKSPPTVVPKAVQGPSGFHLFAGTSGTLPTPPRNR